MTRSSYIKNIKKLFVLLGFYGLSSPRVIGRYIKFAWLNKSSKNDLVKARVFDFDILVPTKSNGIGRALFVHQGRELDHKWMLERVLNSGDYILDLGSNIGYYVLLEAEILHSNCNILAIEPDPRNVGVLNANIALRGLEDLVNFEQCAISNFTGSTSFELAERTNLSKISEPGADNSSALSITVQGL